MSELKKNILVSLLENYWSFNYVPTKYFCWHLRESQSKTYKLDKTYKATGTVGNITLMICWYARRKYWNFMQNYILTNISLYICIYIYVGVYIYIWNLNLLWKVCQYFTTSLSLPYKIYFFFFLQLEVFVSRYNYFKRFFYNHHL